MKNNYKKAPLVFPSEFIGSSVSKGAYTITTPRKWTTQEIEWVNEKIKNGYTRKEIATALCRSEVSLEIKLKRLTKTNDTYNPKWRDEKHQINREFVKYIEEKNTAKNQWWRVCIIDLYAGKRSNYLNFWPWFSVWSYDKNIKPDGGEKASADLALKWHIDDELTFSVVDLDPFGSCIENFYPALKVAKSGLVITLGEMGHKRFKRLDFVSKHYGITSLGDFTSTEIVNRLIDKAKAKDVNLKVWKLVDWQNISRVWFEIV